MNAQCHNPLFTPASRKPLIFLFCPSYQSQLCSTVQHNHMAPYYLWEALFLNLYSKDEDHTGLLQKPKSSWASWGWLQYFHCQKTVMLTFQTVKNLPVVQETCVQSLAWEDPLEKYGNPLQYSCLDSPHGQRNLVGDSLPGHKELDTTEYACTL